MPIAFVGTYPPRRCGIATFTRDLSAAVGAASDHVLPMTIAVSDPGGQYEYQGEVKYEIRQAVKADYARAAEFVNYSDVRLLSIQHEHGIFGVVGATHPMIVRRHGEAYRTSLERESERLGVREHVVFRDQFVSNEELCSYLQAADIYLSPYQNEAQVVSGALSYAMGAGAAVVSTPYWHAQELLSDGRGHLFPFGDHGALSAALRSLLGSPAELEGVRRSAFEFTRSMVWPRIGQAYLELATKVMAEAPIRLTPIQPTRASSLPELRLDHLIRMTDDTGVIQHATYSVPARNTGYCVDDNARALIVALRADRVSSDPQMKLSPARDGFGKTLRFKTCGKNKRYSPTKRRCSSRSKKRRMRSSPTARRSSACTS
ncbi:MAG: glycosyltransferase [Gammaproteobacteria bacterium]